MTSLRVLALSALALLTGCSTDAGAGITMNAYIEARLNESPDPERFELLQPLAEAVGRGEVQDLIFICTHNSRRSHLSQVWAQVAARHFGLDGIQTWSGGTEATAFNPRAVAALQRAGLEVEKKSQEDNPVYIVRTTGGLGMRCFSKRFDDASNPQEGFGAVMTCSDADESCPIVPGASHRFAIPYIDPKVSDGTPEEAATYDARCAQIATEMFWVMREAAKLRG